MVQASPDTASGGYDKDPDTYTLYISASAPGFPDSLRAILDEYEGEPDEPGAPEWLKRDANWIMFRQKRGQFALLFASMAVWKHNRDNVSLFVILHITTVLIVLAGVC